MLPIRRRDSSASCNMCKATQTQAAPRPIPHRVHRAGDQRLLCFRQRRIAHGSAIGGFPGAARHHRRDFTSRFRSVEGGQEFLQPPALGVQRSARGGGYRPRLRRQRQGLVHVDSVSLDGVEVPSFVLEMFVEKYLKPKYPDIGIDSRFALPARVDAATIGLHKVTVIQNNLAAKVRQKRSKYGDL